jgi:hypothetical protein
MDICNAIALGSFISNLDRRPSKRRRTPEKEQERKDLLADSIMTLLKKTANNPMWATFEWVKEESNPEFQQAGYVVEFVSSFSQRYMIYVGYHYDWKNRADRYCFQIKKCATGKFVYNLWYLVCCANKKLSENLTDTQIAVALKNVELIREIEVLELLSEVSTSAD